MENREVDPNEPKGIPFFNIKTGDRHWLKTEPMIAAYINSSDMGINASRGQDMGWRLDAEWVKKIQAFRRDRSQMTLLAAQTGGQRPTTVNILYHLYGEELRAFEEYQEENEAPFQQQYEDELAGRSSEPTPPQVQEQSNNIPNDVNEDDLFPEEEEVTEKTEASKSDQKAADKQPKHTKKAS